MGLQLDSTTCTVPPPYHSRASSACCAASLASRSRRFISDSEYLPYPPSGVGPRRYVAAQVDPFESEVLKPGCHLIGSRFETGRAVSSYGSQLDSQLVQPLPVVEVAPLAGTPGVALQVAFERQISKPVFHLIGYRLWV
jgi:hypothetical protein